MRRTISGVMPNERISWVQKRNHDKTKQEIPGSALSLSEVHVAAEVCPAVKSSAGQHPALASPSLQEGGLPSMPSPRPMKRPCPAIMKEEGDGKKRCKSGGTLFQGHSFCIVHEEWGCECLECIDLSTLINKTGGRVLRPRQLGAKVDTSLEAFFESDKTHILVYPCVRLSEKLATHLKLNTEAKKGFIRGKEGIIIPGWLRACVDGNSILPVETQYKYKEPTVPPAKKDMNSDTANSHRFKLSRRNRGNTVNNDDEKAVTTQLSSPPKISLPCTGVTQTQPASCAGVNQQPPKPGSNLGILESENHFLSDDDYCTDEEERQRTKSEKIDFGSVLPRTWVDDKANRFLCATARGQGKEIASDGMNKRVVDSLNELADVYDAIGDQWRSRANKRAAGTLQRWPHELTKENILAQTQELRRKGIGGRTLAKIQEIVETGSLLRLQNMQKDETTGSILALTTVHGIGPVLARELHSVGVKNVSDLQELAQSGKNEVEGPDGRVVKLPAVVVIGLKYHEDMQLRIDRAEIESIGKFFTETAHTACGSDIVVEIMGSFRRGKPSSHDVDFLVTTREGNQFNTLQRIIAKLGERCELAHLQLPRHESQHGTACYLGLMRPPEGVGNHERMRRFDIRVYDKRCYPYALLHMTGSDHFNRSLRLFAIHKGLKLSDNGLRHVIRDRKGHAIRTYGVGENTINVAECKTEEDVFKVLKLEYVPPEDRHAGVWIVTKDSVKFDAPASAQGQACVMDGDRVVHSDDSNDDTDHEWDDND